MSFFAKFVAKRILGESIQNKFGTEVCIPVLRHRRNALQLTIYLGSLLRAGSGVQTRWQAQQEDQEAQKGAAPRHFRA